MREAQAEGWEEPVMASARENEGPSTTDRPPGEGCKIEQSFSEAKEVSPCESEDYCQAGGGQCRFPALDPAQAAALAPTLRSTSWWVGCTRIGVGRSVFSRGVFLLPGR